MLSDFLVPPLAIENMAEMFSKKVVKKSSSEDLIIKELHAKIGELTVEKDFLQQASNILAISGGRK